MTPAPAPTALQTLLGGARGIPRSARQRRAAAPPPTPTPDALPAHLDFFRATSPLPKRTRTPPAAAAAPPALTALTALLSDDAVVAAALATLGAASPTPVQRRAYPLLCGERAEVVAIAPTGSGKTLAYAAPVAVLLRARAAAASAPPAPPPAPPSDSLHAVRTRARRRSGAPPPPPPPAPRARAPRPAAAARGPPTPACVVLVPTRELAEQVCGVFARLFRACGLRARVVALASKAALCGLAGGGGVDVVVATPARAGVALARGLLDLAGDRLVHVVLDEADRLLEDGFVGQVDGVLAACAGAPRRVHAFSATMAARVEGLLRGAQRGPAARVVVGGGGYGGAAAVDEARRLVRQEFRFVGGAGEAGKTLAVRDMLRAGVAAPVLVFVQSRERAAELFRELLVCGVHADAIHAERSPAARAGAIARFRAGALPVLVATDVLARGLDFRAVATVVNYDVPACAADYLHRVGRTGRAGRPGYAVTLFTEEDAALLAGLAGVARAAGARLPEWVGKGLAGRGRGGIVKRKRVGGGMAHVLRRGGKATVPRRADDDDDE